MLEEAVQFVVAQPLRADGEPAARASIAAPAAVASAAAQPLQAGQTVAVVDADLDADIAAAFQANSVLAEVNGEPITLQTVLGPVQAEVRRWGKEGTREEFQDRCRGLVEVLVREAVIQRLLVDEAKTQLSREERERLTEALAPAAGGPANLLGGLEGLGPQSLTPKMQPADWMLVQGLLREKIAPQVRVTQSELLGLYRQVVQERYVVPTEVRMGLITIRKSDSATPEWAQSLARAVHSRASAGEDFAKLAQRYGRDASAAKGGDYGFIRQGAFDVKAVDDALFALAPGQVAPLVETPETYYIVKALDRHEGRTVAVCRGPVGPGTGTPRQEVQRPRGQLRPGVVRAVARAVQDGHRDRGIPPDGGRPVAARRSCRSDKRRAVGQRPTARFS